MDQEEVASAIFLTNVYQILFSSDPFYETRNLFLQEGFKISINAEELENP
jgi:hypothetical protein